MRIHNSKVHKKIENENNDNKNQNKLFYIKFVLLVFIILIVINSTVDHPNFISTNSYLGYNNISSDKWIVMNVFNPPSDSIINLEKNINN